MLPGPSQGFPGRFFFCKMPTGLLICWRLRQTIKKFQEDEGMVSWLQNQGEMSDNQIGCGFKRVYLILFFWRLDVDDIDICCKIIELLQNQTSQNTNITSALIWKKTFNWIKLVLIAGNLCIRFWATEMESIHRIGGIHLFGMHELMPRNQKKFVEIIIRISAKMSNLEIRVSILQGYSLSFNIDFI